MPANARILLVGAGPSAAALDDRLRGLGYAVCAAVPPDQAVGRAEALGPDLVLTDLDGDPARAGVDAAGRCGAPVVCLVGGVGDDPDDLLAPGRMTVPYGFVFKPADPRQLRLVIHAALAARERERAGAEAGRRLAVAQTVLDALAQPVVALDGAGRHLIVNRAADSIIGGGRRDGPDARPDRVFGGWVLLYADGLTPFQHADLPLARALRGRPSDDVEMTAQRPGGGRPRVHFSVSGRPLRDADGGLMGGLMVVNDITHVKQTERRLQRANAELRRQRGLMRAVLDGIPEGVAALDLRGNRLLVNEVARGLVDLDAHRADEPLERRTEAYGVYLPDRETRYPSEDLPIRRAFRGEAFTGSSCSCAIRSCPAAASSASAAAPCGTSRAPCRPASSSCTT